MLFVFEDSTRAQFEERQTDAERKLAELRIELEKSIGNKNSEKKFDNERKESNDNESDIDDPSQVAKKHGRRDDVYRFDVDLGRR
jgi:hypothetical protein